MSISEFTLIKSYKFVLRKTFFLQLFYRYSYHPISSIFMFSQWLAWFGNKKICVFSYFSFSIIFLEEFSIIFHPNSYLKTEFLLAEKICGSATILWLVVQYFLKVSVYT